jgi:hypothetical protein
MTKNPIINGVAAEIYIVLVVAVMSWGTRLSVGKDNTFLAPLAVISLFTLSAAVMGYIFGLQPIQLYLEGKKKAAVNLFLQTVATFGVLTAVVLGLMFSKILK